LLLRSATSSKKCVDEFDVGNCGGNLSCGDVAAAATAPVVDEVVPGERPENILLN
jgi:hypothetical protein